MNLVKVVKIGSVVMSVLGMVGSAWAADKQNKIDLSNLVSKHLGK